MPEEKILVELDRSDAVSVSEALATCGDSDAERCGLDIRNALGNAPAAHSYYWDNDDNEFRLYVEADSAPQAQIRNAEGEWEPVVDCADLNYEKGESFILLQLMEILLDVDDDDEEADDE